MDYFREQGRIMIATEAGAEGTTSERKVLTVTELTRAVKGTLEISQLNATVKGELPEVGVPVNCATGAAAEAVM